MKTTGVAVIGAGGIGTLRAHSCAQFPQVDYLAICDIVPEKLDRLAESVRADVATEKYEVAIRDERVGAVIVSSDEEFHHGPAALAAELGKPVLIEKPFVLNLDEADDILAKADASGAEIFVGYTQRYRRRFLLAKQAAFAGQLGDIVMALGKIYVTRAVGEAVAKRSPNTTPSINTLTYMVDLILWYMEGKKPVEVYARSASFVFKKYNRDDFQWMIVTFDDGSVATLGTSWLQPHHWPAYTATMEIDLARYERFAERGRRAQGRNFSGRRSDSLPLHARASGERRLPGVRHAGRFRDGRVLRPHEGGDRRLRAPHPGNRRGGTRHGRARERRTRPHHGGGSLV